MERYQRDAEKIAKKAEKHGLGAEAEWLRQSLGITKPIEVTATKKTDPGHISLRKFTIYDRQRPNSRSYFKEANNNASYVLEVSRIRPATRAQALADGTMKRVVNWHEGR